MKELSFGLFATLSEVFGLIPKRPPIHTELSSRVNNRCFADACPQQRSRETCSSKEKTTCEILLLCSQTWGKLTQRSPLQQPLWKHWVRVCTDWRSSQSRRAHPRRVHLLTKTKLRIRSLTRLGHCLKTSNMQEPSISSNFQTSLFLLFCSFCQSIGPSFATVCIGGHSCAEISPTWTHTPTVTWKILSGHWICPGHFKTLDKAKTSCFHR